MVGVLVGLAIFAICFATGKSDTYGSKLEKYISSRNPTNTADIEKLEKEFQEKSSRGVI